MTRPRLVVVSGATATGKTALAVDLARSLGGELVGADSVQLYERLLIGSARPTEDELAGVPHHLLGTLDLRDPYDAAKYIADADRAIEGITSRGKVAIVVGGTGLYLRALVKGLATGIPADAAVRAALHARIAAGDAGTLREMHAEVAAIDPEYAARIHVTDPVRIVRALEVFAVTGEALTEHHRRHAELGPRYEAQWWCLEIERDALRARVLPRTAEMLARGWVDEVRAILADGYEHDLKPLRSVGYAEVVAHLRGELPARALSTEIERATMSFAKRQRTWFRGEPGVEWMTLEAARSPARWEALAGWLRG